MTGWPPFRRQNLVPIGQAVLTVVVLVAVWRVVGGSDVLVLLTSANPMWLLCGVIALTVQTLFSALRWRITAKQLGISLPFWLSVREYYLSQLLNLTLIGGVLGDAARAVRTRGQAGVMASTLAVAFERLAGQMALFVLMSGAVLITFFAPAGLVWPMWAIVPAATLIGGVLVVALLFAGVSFVPSRLGRKVARFRAKMLHALFHPDVAAPQIVLSFATALCNLAAFAFCAMAIGVSLSPAAIFALVPLILFAMLIPLTISGWGVREGAAAALLPLAGVEGPEAFGASVAFGVTMLMAVFPAALLVWFARSNRRASV